MKNFLKKIVLILFTWLARAVLWKYTPKIIGITGSYGKTTTKDIIFAMLAHVVHVRKSLKSFNSEIGVPLAILGCPTGWSNPWVWFKNICKSAWLLVAPHDYPEWLVLEMGVGKAGDMQHLLSWLVPDIAIMTALDDVPVHVEFFESKEALWREKGLLVERTLEYGGRAIVGIDSTGTQELAARVGIHNVMTYGENTDASVCLADMSFAQDSSGKFPQGSVYSYVHAGSTHDVTVKGTIGIAVGYAIAAGITVMDTLDFRLENLGNIWDEIELPRGRMRLVEGIRGSLVVDDTYNASPTAVRAALENVASIEQETGKKIAVLGDMLELGEYSGEQHTAIGVLAAEKFDCVVAVGVRSLGIYEAALDSMSSENVYHFATSVEAMHKVRDLLCEGDIVLVKGSQGVRMEKIVEYIMRRPEDKRELLVRQEKAWEKK